MAEVAKTQLHEHQVSKSQESSGQARTFIQDQKLAATDNSSGKCQDLALPNRKVSSPARNVGLQRDPSFIILTLDREQSRSPERIIQSRIVVLAERIQVPSERVTQQLRDLRDDRDVRPQSVQVDLVRRNTIVNDVSLGEDASEQRQSQRTLSAPCPSDNPDAFTGLDVEVETVENLGTVSTVLGRQILDNEFSAGGPIGRGDSLGCRLGLLLDVCVLLNSLQATYPDDQFHLTTQRTSKSYLFPLTSNVFKYLTHDKIIELNPTAMFNENPIFAADPGF